MIDAAMRKKTRAVKKALDGLEVEYLNSHRSIGVDMARVNGYSIIWHEYAMGADEPEVVEVGMLGGECVRVPINKLRRLVTTPKVESTEPKVMKLYHITRVDEVDYDQYSDFVVAAKSLGEAKDVHPDSHRYSGSWTTRDNLRGRCIGNAVKGMKSGTIVCKSFNAG